MAFEHKPGSFSLFKNDKGDNPNRPDYTGEGMSLDGVPVKVSAWLKEGKNGKFMSCQFQEKTPKTGTNTPKFIVSETEADIPF